MGRHSEIRDLERDIAEREEEYSMLERTEEMIKRLRTKLIDEVESPVKNYDMTVAEEFRGALETNDEEMQGQICSEIHLVLERTSELLSEIVRAKERILEHREKCRRRIDQLWAEIEAESRSSAM